MNIPVLQNSPIPKWICNCLVLTKRIALMYLVLLSGDRLQANQEDWPVFDAGSYDMFKLEIGGPLSCYGSIQLSLSQNGISVVTPAMVISEKLVSYSNFKVIVLETGRNYVDCNDIGKSRSVKVTDTTTNMSCWAMLKVEDKLMPTLNCANDTFPCTVDPFLVRYDGLIDVTDNCDINPIIEYGLNYQKLNCDATFSSIMHVNYIVKDKYGNTAICNKDVYFHKIPLDSIVFPKDDTLYCSLSNQSSGAPMFEGNPVSTLCDLVASYRDDTIPVCGAMYKISRLWVVMDWCLRTNRMQRQEILIADTTRPVISCGRDTIIEVGSSSCTSEYRIPNVSAIDACSPSGLISFYARIDSSFIRLPGSIINLGIGKHTINYIAIDPCGNTDTCTSYIRVEDHSAPSIVCPPKLILSLGTNGDVKLNAAFLNKYVYYSDNCGIDTVLIRRMTSNCGRPMDTLFRDEVLFCCNDLGKTEMVVFKVVDKSGNANFCMIEIQMQNKNFYTINCPSDITVSCSVDIDNLNVTGKPIVSLICANQSFMITKKDSGAIDSCKVGTIKRKFYIQFISGIIDSSCIQEIKVVSPVITPIIVWARDTTISACTPNHPDSIKSKPIVLNDSCGIFKFIYRDSSLMLPPDSCVKILRIWSNVSRCGFGIFRDTQEIKLLDFFAPTTIEPKDSFHCVHDTFCNPFIVLIPLSIKGCNTIKSVTNNYNNGGADASGVYPLGRHEVIFTVIDNCNHIVRDTTIVEVVDKISPVIGCRTITRNIQVNDSAKVIARDLLLPGYSDNCTPQGLLRISFDPANPNDTCRYISCTMHKMFPDSLWPLTVFVLDLSNNSANCTGRVKVEDPSGNCNNLTNKKITVTGLIKSTGGKLMPNVQVNDMMNHSFVYSNDIGKFEITGYDQSSNIDIVPKYNTNWLENISTLDVVRIQKHILGVDLFTHPYEWIAADINKDGKVSSQDIVLLKKLILGNINEVKTNTSWRFIPSDYNFTDTDYPLNDLIPEYYKNNELREDKFVNFVSIKVGDVSGAKGFGEILSSRNRFYSIATDNDELPLGYKSISNFEVEQDLTLEGYQLILQYDSELARPDRIIDYSNNTEGNILEDADVSWSNGEIRISVNANFPKRFNKGDRLFSIVWNNLKKAKLSSVIRETAFTYNEVYTSGYSSYPFIIHIRNGSELSELPEIEDFKQAPNPFSETCNFSFMANAEVDSYLEIIGNDGKKLISKWTPTNIGLNKLSIQSNSLAGPGIYYYKFIVGDFIKKGKLILVK